MIGGRVVSVSRLGAALVCTSLLLGAAAPGAAQTATPAFLEGLTIQVNGAHQQDAGYDFGETVSFIAYDELARFDGSHARSAGAWSVDVGVSLRVWRRLGVGAAYTQFTHSDATTVTGQVPHPFFANQFRLAPAELLELEHREQMTHLQVLWTQPVWDRLDVTIFAGPTFISASQGGLTGLSVSEVAAPYTTIRVDEVTTGEQRINTVSGHIGADATYMITPQIGAGLFVRIVGGSVDVPTLEGTRPVDVGGVQTGVGVRVRF